MTEIWIKIKNFPDYEVSNLGEIRSVDRFRNCRPFGGSLVRRKLKGKILKKSLSKGGYYFLILKDRGRKLITTIHRQVALAFIDNLQNLSEVNHIDGNKLNNVVSNLEWCTRQQNHKHALNGNRFGGEYNNTAKLTLKQVDEIRDSYRKGGITQSELAGRYGVNQRTISDIWVGRNWKDSKV